MESAADDKSRIELLYEIALSSARMLLITRGVEAAQTKRFLHFSASTLLTQSWLNSSTSPSYEAAETQNDLWLLEHADAVLALGAVIENLYIQMDNSMHFPGEALKTPPPKPQAPSTSPDAEKDLRGVLCPMNFVKTKLALDPLSPGQRLKILLDDGAPIQNVPRSVSEEGHKIVEQTRTGGHWTVLIEKH